MPGFVVWFFFPFYIFFVKATNYAPGNIAFLHTIFTHTYAAVIIHSSYQYKFPCTGQAGRASRLPLSRHSEKTKPQKVPQLSNAHQAQMIQLH